MKNQSENTTTTEIKDLILEERQHTEQLFKDERQHTEQLFKDERQHTEQLFKDERKHTEQLLVEERAYNRQLLSEFATEIKNKIDESNQDRVDDVDAVTDRVANLERRVEILEKTV